MTTSIVIAALLAFAVPVSAGRAPAITVVCFGDSLTAGYGIDPGEAYPALLQKKVDRLHWPVRVVNAGLSGETSAGGLRRVDWILKRPADVFLLALGANDGLRGIDPAETERNLQSIVDRVRAHSPKAEIVIAGMQVPDNMGASFARRFRAIFPELARKNNAAFIPFLLNGVALRPSLTLPDRAHPNPAGHQVIVETVWAVLKPILERRLSV